jgi:hypothetical protein
LVSSHPGLGLLCRIGTERNGRSYKNGFVWHDLSDDDLVLPAQGSEYILKGSELLDRSPPPPPPGVVSISTTTD